MGERARSSDAMAACIPNAAGEGKGLQDDRVPQCRRSVDGHPGDAATGAGPR